jgi:hypothetical protein
MKLKKIRWFRNKDALGIGVGWFSVWFGFSIDANMPLRPLISNIPIDKMSGFDFSVVVNHKALLNIRKWVSLSGKKMEGKK